MESTRFDALVRSLAQPASRRRSLGLLLGGAAALAGASTEAMRRTGRRRHPAQAARRDSGAGCKPNCTGQSCGAADGCGGMCHGGCAAGEICCGGTCRPSSVLEGGCPSGSAGFLTTPDGRMRCAAGNRPACACLGVYRDCAPGTRCRMRHGGVICDWP
ncbi:MAG TPA: hypothetical protein VFU81_13505 [Thermomicrobiales bacterium]|nr:hypothetical protein [Thermomicrobiales bacterium]